MLIQYEYKAKLFNPAIRHCLKTFYVILDTGYLNGLLYHTDRQVSTEEYYCYLLRIKATISALINKIK